MRSLPLEAEHAELGARLGDIAGWRLPLDYGDPIGEQRKVRGGAGLIDLSAMGKIRVMGPDRLPFLDGLLTNDLKTLPPGRSLYAATLDHKGRVHGDMVVHGLADQYLLSHDPEAGGHVLAHLNGLLVSDDVTIEDCTGEFAVLGLVGPRSSATARSVLGGELRMETYAHGSVSLGEVPFRVARVPGVGGGAYEIWGPLDTAASLWRDFLAAGAVPFGRLASEALRIEMGHPRYPADMNEETIVLEARLEGAISLTKGCYVGQEVVSRATYVGHVNRLLVGLSLDGESPPKPKAVVTINGQNVGFVTSSARSALLDRVVALGYVRREYSEPGTLVTVDGAQGRVAELPFAP